MVPCFPPGREVMGGACNCWTSEEEREGDLDMVGEAVVLIPPSRSSTVFNDFLFTVWMPEGLFDVGVMAMVGVEGLGPPGGFPKTLGDGLAGKACCAMM